MVGLCCCMQGFSRCCNQEILFVWCTGFSLRWFLLLQSAGSGYLAGFSSCSMWAQELWLMGLVASRHVVSSHNREETCVPYTARQISNHWTTREALCSSFSVFFFFKSDIELFRFSIYSCKFLITCLFQGIYFI